MVYTRSMMKKMKKSTEVKTNNQNYSNLPFDLTLLIMQRLSLKDNIRASVVCKTWLEACVSIRIEDPIPWLMIFLDEEEYELYDPSFDQTNIRKSFPDLYGLHIHYSRDGWLLMDDRNLTKTFFYNPFTQERIGLPWPDMWRTHTIAFSCAPTSENCVLFSIREITRSCITIKLYRLATKECTTLLVPNRLPRKYGGFEHVVFSNGVFYCLTNAGCLGMFDLSTNSWNLLPKRLPKCFGSNTCFMTEFQGDIFLIYRHDLENPTYLKLDLTNGRWREDITLGGLKFYLGSKSTLTTNMDLVYTEKVHQCTGYNIWIKPPINVSDFLTS